MPRDCKHPAANRNGTGHPASPHDVGTTLDLLRAMAVKLINDGPDAQRLAGQTLRGLCDGFDGTTNTGGPGSYKLGADVAATLLHGGSRYL